MGSMGGLTLRSAAKINSRTPERSSGEMFNTERNLAAYSHPNTKCSGGMRSQAECMDMHGMVSIIEYPTCVLYSQLTIGLSWQMCWCVWAAWLHGMSW